ncbi:MAG: lamin tail domain-containing protein, partial [Gracilimonas sp.]
MKKVTTLFSALVLTLIGFTSIQAQEALIISEYLEGSSNNKAIELFNTTDAEIDLSDYRMLRANNGAAEWQDTLNLSGSLAAGGVYVIANASAVQEILDEADTTHSLTFYNGDDAISLEQNIEDTWTLIDIIGILGVDPGSAWDVAGVTEATNEQTLVRKPSVTSGQTDWAVSAGTNADDSQWVVYDQDNFFYLGSHAFGEYNPEPENGTIVNTNSDFLDAELGPTTGIPDWWILGADYVGYEFVADPDNNSNKLLKATITDIASAANPWDAQVATVNNTLEANSTYIISTRLKYESVSDAATGTINFTSGDVGIHQYGLSVNNDEWTVAILDTVKTDTAVAANVGIHLAYDNHEDGDVFHIDYIRIVKLEEVIVEPEPENGTIVNVNSDFRHAELGPTTGIPDWWILGADYVDYEFVADPDINSNKFLKATITDIASAANPWDAQVASVNTVLDSGATYAISGRIMYESSTDAATGTLNFTSGDVGIHMYGASINSGEWTVFALDTVKTDTVITANVGFHIAYDNHENGDVFHIDYIRVVELEVDEEEPAPPSTDQIVWNFDNPADLGSWVNGENSSQTLAGSDDASQGDSSLSWTYTVDPSLE